MLVINRVDEQKGGPGGKESEYLLLFFLLRSVPFFCADPHGQKKEKRGDFGLRRFLTAADVGWRNVNLFCQSIVGERADVFG
jgi:hypothetical protein